MHEMTDIQTDQAQFAELIGRHAPYDGEFALRLPGLRVARASRTSPELLHSVQQPALCLVAQGVKSVYVGANAYEYSPEKLLVYAVNLPIAYQITQASAEKPFLTLRLALEPSRLAELALKLYPHGLPRAESSLGLQVAPVDHAILQDAIRLLKVMADEREAQWLGPLIVEEILTRLLLGPARAVVAQLGLDEGAGRIARAIEQIQRHYDEPLHINTLAEELHLGVSTFHAQFKAVTGLSPLQFQKNLRLQEARRLMVSTALDTAGVGRQVGYASASQFSREYTRLYGVTPRRDMERLRTGGEA